MYLACDVVDCKFTCTNKESLEVHKSSSHIVDGLDDDILPHEVGTGGMHNVPHVVVEPVAATVYACEYPGCNYTHADRDVIIRHQGTHSNEVVYACEANDCSYTCSQKSTLERHKRKMGHGSEALTCNDILQRCEQFSYW